MVGQELLHLLHQRAFPARTIRLFASARSAGKKVHFGPHTYTVEEARPESFDGLDLALFSAGGEVSKALCREAARRGCTVVDNSSALRMEPDVPLVVPEVNAHALAGHRGVVANPNCSTAIALMGLCPLHREFGLVRAVCCTYQAVSGAGKAGLDALETQAQAWADGRENLDKGPFPHPIGFNLFPQVDRFLEDGFTREEHKMLNETRKILEHPSLMVSSTCVRVPVFRAHSIAVHAEFARPVTVARAREVVGAFPGAVLRDDPAQSVYPTPRDFTRQEACGVGRIRLDPLFPNGLAFFVTGDQLWKGAALNALQIAEELHRRGWMKAR